MLPYYLMLLAYFTRAYLLMLKSLQIIAGNQVQLIMNWGYLNSELLMVLTSTRSNYNKSVIYIHRALFSSTSKYMMMMVLQVTTMWMISMLTSPLARAQCSHLQPTIMVIMGMPGYSSVSESSAQVTIMAVIVERTV